MNLHQHGRSKRELFEVIALSLPVALVLTALVPVLGVVTGASTGRSKVAWACALALAAGASGVVAWLRSSKTGGYKRAAARYARLVAGAGQPVVIALGYLAAEPPDGGPLDPGLVALRRQIMSTLRVQCGTTDPDSTRVAIYEFRGTQDLHLADWVGRRDEPRQSFEESDVPYGRNVVEFAASARGDVDRVPDVRSEGGPAPRGDVHRNAQYRSYMSIAVSTAGRSWGMVSVDSPEPGAFRETDEGTIALLAGVLAAGLAHAGVLSRGASHV